MPKQHASPRWGFNSRYLPVGVVGLVLVIFGATIFLASVDLRKKNHRQLIQQDAQLLYVLWQRQEVSDEAEGQLGISDRTSDQLVSILQTTGTPLRLVAGLVGDLIGFRLFDENGKCQFADPTVRYTNVASADLAILRQLKPLARFRAQADLDEVNFALPEDSPKVGPILEIWVPLHLHNQPKLLGVAQFVLDGKNVALAFRAMDRDLAVQALATFLVGGGLLVALLGLGFRQLVSMNRVLIERTQSLLKANQELAMAAKTSAVGAVTAHLIHGLKNPLSGLQTFVSSLGTTGNENAEDWELAVSSTRRMQNMISEIVRVLRDEQGHGAYELSFQELADLLTAKLLPLAKEAGVHFEARVSVNGTMSNRESNLVSLILSNLVQNAIQATPAGKSVSLEVYSAQDKIAFEVRDEGQGVLPAQQALLFTPCPSTKEGGSGIGLAISKQLASCIDAILELKSSGPDGSTFVLLFPVRDGLAVAKPQVSAGAKPAG